MKTLKQFIGSPYVVNFIIVFGLIINVSIALMFI